MQGDSDIGVKTNLVAPSVAGTDGFSNWTPESVFETGFLDNYGQYLNTLSVEQ